MKFICNKAEDAIRYALDSLSSDDVVAIVDPPRAGLRMYPVSRIIGGWNDCNWMTFKYNIY